MSKKTEFPQTLHGAVKYFADEDRALAFMKSIRWPDGVVKCPTCGRTDVSFISTRRIWKCKGKHAKQQFSVKVGTVLEDSPIGLDKWLCAFWLIANAKNGISSYELHRSIGVTQKSAWFMLHRIRLSMQDGSIEKMKGRVEADETFIGGLARNMHPARKREIVKAGAKNARGKHKSGKVAVMGLLERNSAEKHSYVRLKVVKTTRRHEVQGQVRQHVEKGAEVYTDKLPSYHGLSDEYVHNVIDHAECYAKGHVHTNGLENFWSLLKRTLNGTYVAVEPFHLFRYVDEQAFRFNNRKDGDRKITDTERFDIAMSQIIGKRLTYAELTGKVGETTAF